MTSWIWMSLWHITRHISHITQWDKSTCGEMLSHPRSVFSFPFLVMLFIFLNYLFIYFMFIWEGGSLKCFNNQKWAFTDVTKAWEALLSWVYLATGWPIWDWFKINCSLRALTVEGAQAPSAIVWFLSFAFFIVLEQQSSSMAPRNGLYQAFGAVQTAHIGLFTLAIFRIKYSTSLILWYYESHFTLWNISKKKWFLNKYVLLWILPLPIWLRSSQSNTRFHFK